MKLLILCVWPILLGLVDANLLEMSQILWSKLLNGSLSEVTLDPLLVPVVKIDQSQGNIRYRMMLNDVEVLGLNESTIESVHVGRGSVKSNLTEHEAGYVSYNDAGQLDAVRYRFHTVVKEPKTSEQLRVDGDQRFGERRESARPQEFDERNPEHRRRFQESQEMNQRFRGQEPGQGHFQESQGTNQRFRGQEPGQGRFQEAQRTNLRYRNENAQESSYDSRQNAYERTPVPGVKGVTVEGNQRYRSGESSSEGQGQFQQVQGANQRLNSQNTYRNDQSSDRGQYANDNQRFNSQGNYRNDQSSDRRQYANDNQRSSDRAQYASDTQRFNNQGNYRNDQFSDRRQYADDSQRRQQQQNQPGIKSAQRFSPSEEAPRIRNFGESQSNNQQNGNAYENGRDCRENSYGCNYRTSPRVQESGVKGGPRRNYENVGAESVNVESRMRFSSRLESQDGSEGDRAKVKCPDRERIVYAQIPGNPRVEAAGTFENGEFSERLENRPGFVDIVYVDKGSNGDRNVKHFGNLRVEKGQDATVYGLEDVARDLENHRRFIVHNFTEGESLMKKNNLTRANYEMRRIKDLIRYAKNHQEKEGYFEEGMQLIYHYGNNNDSTIESKRSKRAHKEEDNDDDIMHVIVRIRVPLLRVKAGYVLMGKVGEQVLLGDGRLDGNFTNLVGDFTVELKKSNDSMTVRAARARLEAADKNVRLEGMNEKGPVEEILNQGLMAAEAVAAMLADDLATKALSEKTSDSIIYKMYRELPK